MASISEQLDRAMALGQMVVPDLWQQEAVTALRAGRDVVVHAPTGAGKTLIFELWSNQGKCRGQAVYTVPTRALANDKLAEWRARRWDVGIATGDLSDNLNAPVVVATLETQKNRLIAGKGPSLLVVDEYQMLGDPDRGLNYELAIAMAPSSTQLLLLSGSVANPEGVARWLGRLGRDAVVVRHDERPVPLDEVHGAQLSYRLPGEIKGYWPRLVSKALAEDLGPILIFAPRRQAAEALAFEISRYVPCPNPLSMSAEQRALAGDRLVRLLKTRVAYHHSGLSYGARAGVVEPLAKAGQLRVVVATMGLAAGINFSLRSVALAGDSYRRDTVDQPLRPDEILQMFGRAGRRGIDETGYVLVSANELRLRDGFAGQLARSGMVDWAALLGVMNGANEQGRHPFAEAVRVQERLFATRPIHLGVEESLKYPEAPCGLMTDAERARHVRKRVREFLNSAGEWERWPGAQEVPVGNVRVLERTEPDGSEGRIGAGPTEAAGAGSGVGEAAAGAGGPVAVRVRRMTSSAGAMEKVGLGTLVSIGEQHGETVYGRAMTVADRLADGRVLLAKWARRLVHWRGRQVTPELWEAEVVPLLREGLERQGTPAVRFLAERERIVAQVEVSGLRVMAAVDRHGIALWKPPEREVLPDDCARCDRVSVCRELSAATGTALLWRRLNLVDARGTPTLRGRVVSFFGQGNGLAVAAGLEDEGYPMAELVYDLANLDAGFRFCGEENRWAGRLARACQERYGLQRIPGYLENGVPPKYGSGAETVVASVHKDPSTKHAWVREFLGAGDIDRVIIEWRSLLRQIVHAPELDWPRWMELKGVARTILAETESPTLAALPPLEYHQTKRVDHRLQLRRH